MSTSSLWGVNEKFYGEELTEFKNSWLFTPIAGDILFKKYFSDKRENGATFLAAVMFNNNLYEQLNRMINDCDNQIDRVVWEITNQQLFFVKDKDFIADCVEKFLEQNKEFIKELSSNISDRFLEVGAEIRKLDRQEHLCFVFKNTSVDDMVESWFERFNEEEEEYEDASLLDLDDDVTQLVTIKNNKVDGFIPNTELQCATGDVNGSKINKG